MSTITAPHTMLAVKALQSTADVLPLATPHIYTPTNKLCSALKWLGSHQVKKNSAPCL